MYTLGYPFPLYIEISFPHHVSAIRFARSHGEINKYARYPFIARSRSLHYTYRSRKNPPNDLKNYALGDNTVLFYAAKSLSFFFALCLARRGCRLFNVSKLEFHIHMAITSMIHVGKYIFSFPSKRYRK